MVKKPMSCGAAEAAEAVTALKEKEKDAAPKPPLSQPSPSSSRKARPNPSSKPSKPWPKSPPQTIASPIFQIPRTLAGSTFYWISSNHNSLDKLRQKANKVLLMSTMLRPQRMIPTAALWALALTIFLNLPTTTTTGEAPRHTSSSLRLEAP